MHPRCEMWILLCAVLCPILLQGQNATGQINVAVKDPSGAAVEASGKLIGSAGGDRTFQTDAQGTYTFSNLPAGRYRLEVSKNGFATQSISIDVPIGDACLPHANAGAGDTGI